MRNESFFSVFVSSARPRGFYFAPGKMFHTFVSFVFPNSLQRKKCFPQFAAAADVCAPAFRCLIECYRCLVSKNARNKLFSCCLPSYIAPQLFALELEYYCCRISLLPPLLYRAIAAKLSLRFRLQSLTRRSFMCQHSQR